CNQLHNIGIDRISKGLKRRAGSWRQTLKFAETLKARAFPRGHVAPLPRDNWDLGGRHSHKRRRTGRFLDSNAGGPKLDYIGPDIALPSFAIPFKLLQTGGECKKLRQPRVNPVTV